MFKKLFPLFIVATILFLAILSIVASVRDLRRIELEPFGQAGQVSSDEQSQQNKESLSEDTADYETKQQQEDFAAADTSSWNAYRNEKFGFELKHPGDFLTGTEEDDKFFMYYSDPQDNSSVVEAIIIEIKSESLEEIIEQYDSKGEDSEPAKQEKLKLGNASASKLTFTDVSGEEKVSVFIPSREKNYLVSFSNFNELSLGILSTFKIF